MMLIESLFLGLPISKLGKSLTKQNQVFTFQCDIAGKLGDKTYFGENLVSMSIQKSRVLLSQMTPVTITPVTYSTT